jgi:hypothetical protein
MKTAIIPIFAAFAFASSLTASVIEKSGSYRSASGTTSLQISDAEVAVAKFIHVTPDGRKTQSEAILGANGTWACLFEGEWTIWIYKRGESFVRAITIIPPEDEKLQFRKSIQKVYIAKEAETIPTELRALLK